jgi:hypothetical protein
MVLGCQSSVRASSLMMSKAGWGDFAQRTFITFHSDSEMDGIFGIAVQMVAFTAFQAGAVDRRCVNNYISSHCKSSGKWSAGKISSPQMREGRASFF